METALFTEPQQGATYDQLLAIARTAESVGFGAFFRSDHYLTMGGDGLPGPTDAWITLAGLARETQRIRLGTLVSSSTFRLAGPLSIAVAQVDAMSGGRVELGLGTGWYDDEHRAYGIPFPPLGERFAILEEQLAVITGLWTTPVGDHFDFTGQHITVQSSPALPKPVQQPHPPIVIGGGGPRRTPRLAARYATELNAPFMSVADTQAQFKRARGACEAIDRDPKSLRLSSAVVVCCAENDAELGRRAARIGREVDELRTNGAAGTPDEVVDRIRQYADVGAGRIFMQMLDVDDLDHVALVGEAVLPLL